VKRGGGGRPGAAATAAIIETSGATVTSQQALRIDAALLEATAPILNLQASSSMTTAVDALNLVSKAKITSVGPVIKLDASTLTVTSGAAINVAGGSLLKITGGDLVHLNNGSTLTMSNGPLLNVTGNSVVNVFGALVNFGGTGTNVVNVTNTLCGGDCATGGTIPVFATGGAVAGAPNISITNPIKNGTLANISTSGTNAAVIVVNGASSKVTISGNP
jgi:hypothetical protein